MEGEGTMWKDHIGNVCRLVSVHILIATLLCGCSKEEELYPLGHSRKAHQEAEDAEAGKEAVETGGGENRTGSEGNMVPESVSQAIIYVHVCGAVLNPGVVEIPAGSRAQAAVDAAGGFAEAADTAYVNLAAPIADGEQLYIPTKEEAEELRKNQAVAASGMVNLNTADVKLLCTLPGIGESRAGDIIAYRQQNGGFTDTKEIMQVPGIKANTYDKIKDLITAD